MAELYYSADIVRLEEDDVLRRMGDDFFGHLRRCIRGHQQLTVDGEGVEASWKVSYKLVTQLCDVLVRKSDIAIRMQESELGDLAWGTDLIDDHQQTVLDDETRLLGRDTRLEAARKTPCAQESRLYELAIPVLVSEGLLSDEYLAALPPSDQRNSSAANPELPRSREMRDLPKGPDPSESTHANRDPGTRKDGANEPSQEKPQIKSVNERIRTNALEEYQEARKVLFEDRETLEKAHETGRKRKALFHKAVQEGTMRGAPSDYDRCICRAKI